ncbi:3-isopropylmalate dehydratase [candidate division MSBL1 archaeon SCGC-AAA833F18]|uniref:3-isopropylmalate dehydratase large subunit n=1 Tax=candidate division MSBL1 archaeon SCGC-AAA833F18 TaxID=1698257 RepID=A0A133VT86_9EURY|nr:3-isopropylmalate dehydratase [candidate division MSBL1 archaeon SCGC-AAA833F18]
MGMTIAEKILARNSGRGHVEPGDVVRATIDKAMANDITAPLTVDAIKDMDLKEVWNPEKIVIVFDHQAPPTTVKAAEDQDTLRKFASQQGIKNIYGDFEGVCHQIMLEKPHVLPGQLVVGADSHTCTYGALGCFAAGIGSTDMAAVFSEGKLWFRVPESVKIQVKNRLRKHVTSKDLILKIAGDVGADGAIYRSIEFVGTGIGLISTSGRMTLCNMGVEMGAKTAIVPPDEKTREYISKKTDEDYVETHPDPDAEYVEELEYSALKIDPMVACPHSVDNVKTVDELEDVKIQQAFLGSCTNGRLEDLAKAADILKGEQIDKGVKMLVAPASREVFLRAMEEGIIGKLVESGAIIEPPGCTTCWGGHIGILAPGETCISSSNRNFRGRMGSPEAEIYLASPTTVAASALTGEITNPRDL